MPKSFDDISAEYQAHQQAGNPLVGQQSLQQYSQMMNGIVGNNDYAAGVQGDPYGLRSLNSGINSLINKTGIPQVAGSIGGGLGGAAFGERGREAGEAAGAGIPRAVGSVGLGALLAPETGGASLLATAPFVADSALQGYGQSGTLSGAAEGALGGLAPLAGGALGRTVVGAGASELAQFLGSQAGALGGIEASRQAFLPSGADRNPFTPENIVSNVLGLAPFVAHDLLRPGGLLRGKETPEAQQPPSVDPVQDWVDNSKALVPYTGPDTSFTLGSGTLPSSPKPIAEPLTGRELAAPEPTSAPLPLNNVHPLADRSLYGKPIIDITPQEPVREPLALEAPKPLTTEAENLTSHEQPQARQTSPEPLQLEDKANVGGDKSSIPVEPSVQRVPIENVAKGAEDATKVISEPTQTHEESQAKVEKLVQIAHSVDAEIPQIVNDPEIAKHINNGAGTDAEKVENANQAVANDVQDSIARESVLRDAEDKAGTEPKKAERNTQEALGSLSNLTPEEAKAVADVVAQHSHKEGSDQISDAIYKTAAKLVRDGKVRTIERGTPAWNDTFKKSLGQAAMRPRLQTTHDERTTNVEVSGDKGTIVNPEVEKQQAAEWNKQNKESTHAVDATKQTALDNMFINVARDLKDPEVLGALKLQGARNPKDVAGRARALVEFLSRYGHDGSGLSASEKAQSIDRLRQQLGFVEGKNGKDQALKYAKANGKELAKLPAFMDFVRGPEVASKAMQPKDMSQKEFESLLKVLQSRNGRPTANFAVGSVEKLFNKITRNLGLDQLTSTRLTENAKRIVDVMTSKISGADNTLFTSKTGPTGYEGILKNFSGTGTELEATHIKLHTDLAKEGYTPKDKVYNLVNYLQLVGHELWHGIERASTLDQLNPRQQDIIDTMRSIAGGMTQDDKAAVLYNLYKATGFVKYKNEIRKVSESEAKRIFDHIEHRINTGSEQEGKQDADEFLATVAGVLSLGRGQRNPPLRDLQEFIAFQSKAMQNFTKLIFTDLTNVSHLVKGYFDAVELGSLPGVPVGKFIDVDGVSMTSGEAMKALIDGYRELTKTPPKVVEAEQSLLRLTDNITNIGANRAFESVKELDSPLQPMARTMAAQAGLGSAKDVKGSERLSGVTPGFLDNFLFSRIYAEVHPLVKGVFLASEAYRPMAHRLVNDIKAGIMGNTTTAFSNIAKSTQLRGALDDLRRLQGEDRTKPLSDTTVISNLEAKGITGAGAQDVLSVFKGALEVGRVAREKLKAKLDETLRNYGTSLLRTGSTLPQEKVEFLGKAAFDALQNPSDPLRQMKVQQLAQSIGDPDLVLRLSNTYQQLKPELDKAKATLDSQPGYVPESRPGPFSVRYTIDGKEHFDGFSSADKFDKFLSGLKSRQGAEILQTFKKGDSHGYESMSQSMLESLQSMETALYKHALENVPSEYRDEVLKSYTPLQDMRQEMLSSSYRKYQAQREGVPETALDTLESVLNYAQSVGNGIARQSSRELANIRVNDPELQKNPELLKRAQDQIEFNLNTNDGKNSQYVRQAIATYYMGLNPVSALVQAIQPLQTLAPFLTKNGATIPQSYKMTAEALLLSAQGKANGGKYGAPDLDAAMQRAHKENVLESTLLDQLDETKDAVAATFLNNGDTVMDKAKLWANSAWQTMRMSSSLHQMVYRLNNEVAFISGYKLAQKNGLSGEQAYAFATDTVKLTMLTGGRANRPAAFQSVDNKMNSAVAVALTMSNYQNGLLSMYAWYFKDALGRTGLGQADKAAATKAFGQLLGTQALMAGILGLPLVGGTMALLQQLFPTLQIRKDLQEGVAKLAGDDQQLGGALSGYVMKGLASNVAGVDVSSRLGLGGYLGLEQSDGLNLASFFGPGSGILQNFVKGTNDALQGNAGAAAEDVVPSFLKQIVNEARNDGNIYDKNGRLLIQPTQTENALRAIGFRSSRLSDLQDQRTMQNQSEAASKIRSTALVSKLAQQLADGDSDSVREALLAQKKVDPNFDIQSTLSQIAQRSVDRQIPLDPLRDNTSRLNFADVQGIAKLYANSQQQPSEVQRLVLAKQLEQKVGLLGSGQVKPEALSRAAAIDQVLGMNPTISRGQAALMVERMMHPDRESALGSGQ